MIYIYREVANISNNEFVTILNVRLKDPTLNLSSRNIQNQA